MRYIFKKWIMAALCALCCTLLTGCFFSSPVEDLYQLPQLPEEYTALSNEINAVLTQGAEYAAPTGGSNLPPVQMVDIDSDGTEEALAFFRNDSAEKPLQIYVFSAREDTYTCTAVIEGTGTGINSVAYSDVNGNGILELIVGWKISADVQMLSLYGFVGDEVTEHITAAYAQYTLSDLDGDGCQELVVFHAGEEGDSYADYYNWEDEAVTLVGTTRISATIAQLGKVTSGTLRDKEPVLFVSGLEENEVVVTDILMLRDGQWSNITLQDTTGVSSEIFHFMSLYPKDVNGDGVTEVPRPVVLPVQESKDVYYEVYWCSYDTENEAIVEIITYHNMTDGWYLVLPEEWDGEITVSRSKKLSDQADVSFYYRDESSGEWQEFMVISKLTGDNRVYRADRGDNNIIHRQSDAIFTVRFMPASTEWSETPNEEEVKSRFGLIYNDWATGVN